MEFNFKTGKDSKRLPIEEEILEAILNMQICYPSYIIKNKN